MSAAVPSARGKSQHIATAVNRRRPATAQRDCPRSSWECTSDYGARDLSRGQRDPADCVDPVTAVDSAVATPTPMWSSARDVSESLASGDRHMATLACPARIRRSRVAHQRRLRRCRRRSVLLGAAGRAGSRRRSRRLRSLAALRRRPTRGRSSGSRRRQRARPGRSRSASTRRRTPVPPTSASRRMADAYAKKTGSRSRSTPSTTTPSRRTSTPTCRARRTTSSPGSPATAWRTSPRRA